MSKPYIFRPRRGHKQRCTDVDSDSEMDPATMAEDVSSQDPDWTDHVSSHDNSRESDSSDVRHHASRVRVSAPPLHRAVTATSRATNITPTHTSTRSVDSSTSRLGIGQTARPQTAPKQPIKNQTETGPDYNPLRRAPKRVASAPALRDANGRAKQRFERGLSPESEAEEGPRLACPVVEQDPTVIRFSRRTQIPSRPSAEGHDGNRQHSEMMPDLGDASLEESDKENGVNPALRARVKSLLQDQSRSKVQPRRRIEEASRPQQVTGAPAPAPTPAVSSRHPADYSEYGYGYGFHVPDPNESSFFLDALPPDFGQAFFVEDPETSHADQLFATHPLLAPGTMTEDKEIPETGSKEEEKNVEDDPWMADFIDISQFEE